MSSTADILFEYLRNIIYEPSKAVLDIGKLDDDYVMLGKGLMYFAQCFYQYNEFAKALAKGDLSVPPPPPENELAAPLKLLHASLRHLTWQSEQVAMGDYKQRVDFMGDFSNAFNTMIEQLAERQQKLEQEIEITRNKSKALAQSNQLLTNITQYITQQIIVIDRDTREVLFMNDMARAEVSNDAEYIAKLMDLMPAHHSQDNGHNIELRYGARRYLAVNSYFVEWDKASAEAFVISDISNEKRQIEELEIHAYRDAMTHLFNRLYGMLTLNEWLDSNRAFVLIFSDLDSLKYINDRYGHIEGDKYIISAAKCLKVFSSDAVVCRLGGDEFMLLAPDISYDEAQARMTEIYHRLQNDEYLNDKEYTYSISFGIVFVGEDNGLSASEILGLADERMYEHKKMRKKNRQAQVMT